MGKFEAEATSAINRIPCYKYLTSKVLISPLYEVLTVARGGEKYDVIMSYNDCILHNHIC